MSYNALILERLEAEKVFALILDRGANETGRQILQQAQTITAGLTRLTWYSSCFFDNYQDVCANLKNEDVRFVKSIIQIIKKPNIVRLLIETFVDYWLWNIPEERINKIEVILLRSGANISSSTYTTRSFTYAITSAICLSFGFRAAINSKLKSRVQINVIVWTCANSC